MFKMGLFGFILLVVITLAVFGLGWQTFSSGVITGFEKAVDVGIDIMIFTSLIEYHYKSRSFSCNFID
jgi:hypothetical protein